MLKKLLLAASMAALTTGSAHALDVVITTPSTSVHTPAEELIISETAPFIFDSAFALDTSDPINAFFPVGTTLVVDIELPEGVTFGVPGAPVTSVTSSNFQVLPNGSGGGAGTRNVSYLITTLVPNISRIPFSFDDLELTECLSSATVSINAVTEAGGTDVDGGSAESTGVIINNCASALNGTVVSDSTVPGDSADSIIQLLNYTTITDEVSGVVPVADISYSINATVDLDETPTAMVNADVSAIEFVVQFEDLAGITNVGLQLNGDTAALDTVANTATFSLNASQVASFIGRPDVIEITIDGTTEIVEQDLTVLPNSVGVTFANPVLIPAEALSLIHI